MNSEQYSTMDHTPSEKSNYNLPPSKVVHCRAVAEQTKETDLVDAMKIFGNVKGVRLMPSISQGLIEFETIESAIACVTYCAKQPIVLYERQMYTNYSKSTEISRKFKVSAEQAPTNILLFTVINVIHPINVDTLKTVCEQQNVSVQRILIFHKNGLQAFVEFKSVDDAAQILLALNGCDIYPGSCTLKIEYSKTKPPLNVKQNNDESYSVDLLSGSGGGSLLGGNVRYNDWDSKPLSNAYSAQPSHNNSLMNNSSYSSYGAPPYSQQFGNGGGGGGGGEGCVAMVYNINNNVINCNHLFNLLCLYGNVMKVKILTQKEGMAMVQYESKMNTDMAMRYFNNLDVHGKQLQLVHSKAMCINDGRENATLFDGSPSQVNFSSSRNNRFMPVKNGNDPYARVQGPSKVLHYYNAPADITEDQISTLFQSNNAEVPLKQANIAKPGAKSASGLLEFSSISAAAVAIMFVNHVTLNKLGEQTQLDESGKTGPLFTFKLAFSSSNTINQK